MTKYGIFTKDRHVTKIVNFLNEKTTIDYVIGTEKWEVESLDFDIGVSYCFPWLIDIASETRKGRIWYNYHPAPLPEYGGWGNYDRGIHDMKVPPRKPPMWGVSLHLIDAGIDTGPVIAKRPFVLEGVPVNRQELADLSHYHLFQLFKHTIEYLSRRPTSQISRRAEIPENWFSDCRKTTAQIIPEQIQPITLGTNKIPKTPTVVSVDSRGSIIALPLNKDKDIVVLYTKSGKARGGCIHPNSNENFVVVEGQVLMGNPSGEFLAQQGCIYYVSKNIPHYMKSITDSIVIEWGALRSDKDFKDAEMKRKVDGMNRKEGIDQYD